MTLKRAESIFINGYGEEFRACEWHGAELHDLPEWMANNGGLLTPKNLGRVIIYQPTNGRVAVIDPEAFNMLAKVIGVYGKNGKRKIFGSEYYRVFHVEHRNGHYK